MFFEDATKKQLLQIALFEDCPLEYKNKAVCELQMRWTDKLLPDLILLYGEGLSLSQIAIELGID